MMTSVNLGGLHYRVGRIQILKGISLDDSWTSKLNEKALGCEGRFARSARLRWMSPSILSLRAALAG